MGRCNQRILMQTHVHTCICVYARLRVAHTVTGHYVIVRLVVKNEDGNDDRLFLAQKNPSSSALFFDHMMTISCSCLVACRSECLLRAPTELHIPAMAR